MPGTAIYPIKDRMVQITTTGNLVGNDIQMTSAAVDASVTVSAEGATVANQRDIVIQLKDANGVNIDYVEEVELVLFTSNARAAYVVTGGSTGVAAGASGAIQTILAKKVFRGITTAAGLLTIIYTDTGTESVALGVRLPTGRYVMGSSVLTCA
jgi:hypothetical protein